MVFCWDCLEFVVVVVVVVIVVVVVVVVAVFIVFSTSPRFPLLVSYSSFHLLPVALICACRSASSALHCFRSAFAWRRATLAFNAPHRSRRVSDFRRARAEEQISCL